MGIIQIFETQIWDYLRTDHLYFFLHVIKILVKTYAWISHRNLGRKTARLSKVYLPQTVAMANPVQKLAIPHNPYTCIFERMYCISNWWLVNSSFLQSFLLITWFSEHKKSPGWVLQCYQAGHPKDFSQKIEEGHPFGTWKRLAA